MQRTDDVDRSSDPQEPTELTPDELLAYVRDPARLSPEEVELRVAQRAVIEAQASESEALGLDADEHNRRLVARFRGQEREVAERYVPPVINNIMGIPTSRPTPRARTSRRSRRSPARSPGRSSDDPDLDQALRREVERLHVGIQYAIDDLEIGDTWNGVDTLLALVEDSGVAA